MDNPSIKLSIDLKAGDPTIKLVKWLIRLQNLASPDYVLRFDKLDGLDNLFTIHNGECETTYYCHINTVQPRYIISQALDHLRDLRDYGDTVGNWSTEGSSFINFTIKTLPSASIEATLTYQGDRSY